jgi:hypothetical protein
MGTKAILLNNKRNLFGGATGGRGLKLIEKDYILKFENHDVSPTIPFTQFWDRVHR